MDNKFIELVKARESILNRICNGEIEFRFKKGEVSLNTNLTTFEVGFALSEALYRICKEEERYIVPLCAAAAQFLETMEDELE